MYLKVPYQGSPVPAHLVVVRRAIRGRLLNHELFRRHAFLLHDAGLLALYAEFLALVANERKGRTRVAAAIRAMNFIRRLLGIRPISEDPRTTLLQEGVLRTFPHKA